MPLARNELFPQKPKGLSLRRRIFDFLDDSFDQGFTLDEIIDGLKITPGNKRVIEPRLRTLVEYHKVEKIEQKEKTYYIIKPGKLPLPSDMNDEERKDYEERKNKISHQSIQNE